jgi:hypothetical protein
MRGPATISATAGWHGCIPTCSAAGLIGQIGICVEEAMPSDCHQPYALLSRITSNTFFFIFDMPTFSVGATEDRRRDKPVLSSHIGMVAQANFVSSAPVMRRGENQRCALDISSANA